MKRFKSKIKERHQKQFYGMITGQLLRKLDAIEATELKANFQEFLQTTLDYVDKWFRLERFPKAIGWIGLEQQTVRHEDVMELASELAPELEDNLFDEVTDLNRILGEVTGTEFDTFSAVEKWRRIFKAQLPNLLALVGKVLTIPVSNAYIERVFSLCSAQWTDVNGRTTNKINIMIECFKREDNPTSYCGYWEDKDQDPIHIDDIQSSIANATLRSAQKREAYSPTQIPMPPSPRVGWLRAQQMPSRDIVECPHCLALPKVTDDVQLTV
uniref:HAT C-terminal dimerisation domain-containing protein n=1 Tax=Globodera rostochiensis TaxID=31243 RepID=A0A914HAM1_GLORO